MNFIAGCSSFILYYFSSEPLLELILFMGGVWFSVIAASIFVAMLNSYNHNKKYLGNHEAKPRDNFAGIFKKEVFE